MDLRYRLTDIIDNAFRNVYEICESVGCENCSARTIGSRQCRAYLAAEYAIKNGVTVETWTSILKSPPKQGVSVIGLTDTYETKEVYYDGSVFRKVDDFSPINIIRWTSISKLPESVLTLREELIELADRYSDDDCGNIGELVRCLKESDFTELDWISIQERKPLKTDAIGGYVFARKRSENVDIYPWWFVRDYSHRFSQWLNLIEMLGKDGEDSE